MDVQHDERQEMGLRDAVNATPEDLNELRSIVEEWLKRARKAVWTFKKENGAFQRDSETPNRSSVTTTARCYMALASVERQLLTRQEDECEQWEVQLAKYLENFQVKKNGSVFTISEPSAIEEEGNGGTLNNFEVAHLADFEFARRFCNRFGNEPLNERLKEPIDFGEKDPDYRKTIAFLTKKLRHDKADSVEIPFDTKSESSRHYFVTLHILRAIKVFAYDNDDRILDVRNEIAEKARVFCIEQCFYFQRGIRHMQDPARLVLLVRFTACTRTTWTAK